MNYKNKKMEKKKMGKFSRKTEKNRIRTEDKIRKANGEVPKEAKTLTNRMINGARRIDKEAQREIEKQAVKISEISKACLLCYSMSLMKEHWKFSTEKLKLFYEKWLYTRESITYKSGVPVSDLLVAVTGTDYGDGNLGFKKYKVRGFDKNKDEFDKMPGDSTAEKLMNYYARKKMVGCMNFDEVVTLLVLYDYFDFRAVKLAHYIERVRGFYDMSFTAAKNMVAALEEKCKTQFEAFEILKTTRENGAIRIKNA